MTTTPPDHHLLSLPNATHHHAVPFISDHIITQPPPPPTASHFSCADVSNAMINPHLPPLDSFKSCPGTSFSFFSPLIDNMQVNMPPAAAAASKCTAMDVTSMLLNLGNSVDFGQQNNNSYQFAVNHHHLQPLEAASSGLSFTLPAMFNSEEWKPLSLPCTNYNNSSSNRSSAYI